MRPVKWVTPKELAANVSRTAETVRDWCKAGLVWCQQSPGGTTWLVAVDASGLPLPPRELEAPGDSR